MDITEQIQAEDAIRQMNTVLENRVQARTAQLEQANRELESFSYSVSHDLRTPLRAIDGYTHILMEDFYPGLPPEGRQVCDAILNNTRRMSQLIDDLLAFSRLSRSEMRQVPVDMHGLVDLAFDELTTPETRQEIVFNLQSLPGITGDPSMMRQVWLNLVSNAIKFSSHHTPVHIEVGFTPAQDEMIYYIRDNGDGFDMEFSGKLFGVFQRLHGVKDFEGTGVGLAIVKRVIQRHGGRVWAEGEPGAGATFYFALPMNVIQPSVH
jgi:light-regulated signal transduction histidine kinase (bacteriophytochrome)